MTSAAPGAAAAIPAAPSSTLSPHAAPFTLRTRPVCAPPGSQQDGDVSRSIDDNSMVPSAYIWMESCDAACPASSHGMHQNHPSSSSGTGIHANVYPSPASSTSRGTWMASDSKQEQFPLTSGTGSKSTKVTIKCPPARTSGTSNISNISFSSKSKLVIRENDECNIGSGKDISCRNLPLSNPANANGSSQGTMELNPCLKPLNIPSARASSVVSVADDMNPDPSECSVDSPCWQGALASRVSSLNVLQTSDGQAVKQELVNFNAGRGILDQGCEASAETEKLAASKSKQNHSHPSVELGGSKQPEDVDTNLKDDSHGKEVEHAKHGVGKCNAEHTHCLEVRNICMKRSGLNSAAPDFIPSSIRKSSSGNGLPSSSISQGSCSSGRNTSEILKAIKSLSDVLQNSYYDGIELPEHDLGLLQSIIETLQSLVYKERKDPVKVSSDKAGLKAFHSENELSKSFAVNQNVMKTADKGKGIVIPNMPDYRHSHNDVGRNSLTGYQPVPNNFGKESSLSCEESQVLLFNSLWIDAERANCALKYQLKQTRMAVGLESSMTHNGGDPRNPCFQLCDAVTGPNSSVGLAVTCPPMLKNHPGARKTTTNLIYVGDDIHSGSNNVLSRSKDYVLKNIQGGHFLLDVEETGIRHGLQLVPNKSHTGLNSTISDGVSSHSYLSGRDDIFPATCEYGLSDWEHVQKDEG